MLDAILIAIPTGIVSRLAKSKGHDPVLFGVLTAALALICAVIGFYFLGLAGEILGIFIGGIVMEEIVRNRPGKAAAKKKVYCPHCGVRQDWEEDKLCARCRSPLRR